MKVARKLTKKVALAPIRATLTLTRETYRKIDALRGGEPRSVWVQRLIEREERRRERQRFAATLRERYTDAVCRETLAVHDEFPIDEAGGSHSTRRCRRA